MAEQQRQVLPDVRRYPLYVTSGKQNTAVIRKYNRPAREQSRKERLLKKPYISAICLLLFTLSPLASTLVQGQFPAAIDIHSSGASRGAETSFGLVYATDLAKAVYEQVSVSSFQQFIVKLTENGSRYYGSEANTQAISWLTQELVGLSNGKINVSVLGNYKSVVGRLPGYLGTSGPSIVIGGHFDTVSVAPGANDDGSGVATVLELARVLSQYDWPLNIYFCLWNSEEQGLRGSGEVSTLFLSKRIDVLVDFNVDMLLVQDPNRPSDQRILMNYQVGSGTIHQDARYWAEMARCMSSLFATPIIYPSPSSSFPYWRQSDHYPFVQRGYKSNIFAFETGMALDNAYHTSQDRWDNVLYNYTVAAAAIASIGASIAFTLSRTQGQLTYSEYSTDLASGASRDYLFEMTMPTEVDVRGSWSGADSLEFSVFDPYLSGLASNSTNEESAANATVLRLNTSALGIHTLRVTNTGVNATTVHLVIVHDTDLEGNSIPDSQEFWHNAFLVDTDGDGASNGDEMILGLDRFNPDTDNDDLNDGDEILLHTDPKYYDSDYDGMSDGWEVKYSLNPLVDDSASDPDGDGLSNIAEYGLRTNPRDDDTDRDGMSDGWEVDNVLKPLVNDSGDDPDQDGLTNAVEFLLKTNPQSNDTDKDGMPDGWEEAHSLNPLVDDSQLDPDGDGLTNRIEYQTGHDPHIPDSIQSVPSYLVLLAGIGCTCALAFLIVVKVSARHEV